MANICDTTYIIHADDTKALKEVHSILEELKEKNSRIQVYDFLQKLGYSQLALTDCRGEIYNFEYDETDDGLTIDVDSSWNRLEGIEDALYDFLGWDSTSIIYASEELGCDIFETNDYSGSFFSLKYYYFSSDDESEYLDGEQELVDYVKDFYDKEVCSNEQEAFDYVESHSTDENGNPTIYKREII